MVQRLPRKSHFSGSETQPSESMKHAEQYGLLLHETQNHGDGASSMQCQPSLWRGKSKARVMHEDPGGGIPRRYDLETLN